LARAAGFFPSPAGFFIRPTSFFFHPGEILLEPVGFLLYGLFLTHRDLGGFTELDATGKLPAGFLGRHFL
jgi:hypothetical protein